MKTEIATKQDIKLLVDTFYEKVKIDATIGFFFTEVVQVKWEKEWENVKFCSDRCRKNKVEIK